MKSKRIQWLDFTKGLLIFIVVLCHSLFYSDSDFFSKTLEYILLVFAMPLFFSISGFFIYPPNSLHEYKILLYKKIGSFLLPYIIFTFLDIILHLTSNHNPLDNFYRIYLIPVGYLWFLYSLFFIFVIVGFMDLIHMKFGVQLTIFLILLFGQMYLPWQESAKGNINPLAGIGGYMICFYLGYMIKENHWISALKSHVLFLSMIWIILLCINIINTGVGYNTDIFNYSDVFIKLSSIPIFFSLFVCCHHNRFFYYFDKYGKCTLIIYLVHLPVISVISDILNKIPLNVSILSPIILIICGWYISVFVYYLSKKYRFINFIFYPRKYINFYVL